MSDHETPPPKASTEAVSTPRRIVFLVTHSSAGGAQEIWSNLAEGFKARGDRVSLAALYPSGVSMLKTPPGLDWIHISDQRPRLPLGPLGLLQALASFLTRERPDIVFTALPAANILVAVAATITRVPTRVINSHHSPAETYNPLLNLVDGFAGVLPAVSDIVAVSHTVARSNHTKPSAYRAKLKTILNALPPRIEARIGALARQRPRDVAKGRLVVATGRLTPQKNYPTLVHAAAHLGDDVTIRIIGAGPDEADLKALAADLGVATRIEFAGHHPREDAMALLADGDVFVQPSLFEGHSLALVEAAHLGLPLVVSDAPVQVEGVTDSTNMRCGVVVGTMDHETLAREIQALLNDPARYADYAERSSRLGAEATYVRMFAAYADLAA